MFVPDPVGNLLGQSLENPQGELSTLFSNWPFAAMQNMSTDNQFFFDNYGDLNELLIASDKHDLSEVSAFGGKADIALASRSVG
jgi:hypothetical protein